MSTKERPQNWMDLAHAEGILAELESGHAVMPVEEVRQLRSAGMRIARRVYDAALTGPDRAEFEQAHTLLVALDRVGQS